MPAYANLQEFLTRVRIANRAFRRSTSSLRNLISILESATGTAGQVQAALAQLPTQKANQYKDALYYLQRTYPALAPNSLHLGALGKTAAARFARTALPVPYNPAAPVMDRVVPNSIFLNQNVEQFLLTAPVNTGVLLIHLSTFIGNMNDTFNNWKVVDHMNSALRVAWERNLHLCVLHQNNPPVCSQLIAEVNSFANSYLAHVHPHHMGGHDANFITWAQNHDPIVVMGFDACVCVRANLFGSPEVLAAGGFVAPLITYADVVTSRAVLVTNGAINPVNHRGEWGVLYNT
jgi:hypothetical protein